MLDLAADEFVHFPLSEGCGRDQGVRTPVDRPEKPDLLRAFADMRCADDGTKLESDRGKLAIAGKIWASLQNLTSVKDVGQGKQNEIFTDLQQPLIASRRNIEVSALIRSSPVATREYLRCSDRSWA